MSKDPILTWMDDGDEFDWDCMIVTLTDVIKKLNPSGNWHCEVKNFGWMKKDGYANFTASDGSSFLSWILPDTNCHFKIFKERNTLKIQNYHHDSPCGDEWYTIKKARA